MNNGGAYETWRTQLEKKNQYIRTLICAGDRLMQAARNCSTGCAAKSAEHAELTAAMGEWVAERESWVKGGS